jgi:hypothetical protein
VNFAGIAAPILLGLLLAYPTGAAAQNTLLRRALGNTTATLVDSDGDGLDDALEMGQKTSTDLVDTDGDGWNDAEELARGSLGVAHCSQPPTANAAIGSRAYMRDGRLHSTFAIYLHSGSLAGVKLNLGIYTCHTMIPLAPSSYTQFLVVKSIPSHGVGELVLVADVVLSDLPLRRSGAMSIYGTLQVGQTVVSATAINLVSHGGTPIEVIQPNQLAPDGEQQLGPGVLYRPLGGTQTPVQWSTGEICFQQLESVGTHGAVVTQEVTSASCVGGWDGYCDGGNCNSSVGTTLDLIDPAALVGG